MKYSNTTYVTLFLLFSLLLAFPSCKKDDPATNPALKPVFTGTKSLVQPRNLLAAAAAGNKILFGGGSIGETGFCDTVDIFDLVTNQHTTAVLKEPRRALAAAGLGNKILFAGGVNEGGTSRIIDIYDVSSNSWSFSTLSVSRAYLAGAGAGNKILFAGGWDVTGADRDVVDIYDIITGVWTESQHGYWNQHKRRKQHRNWHGDRNRHWNWYANRDRGMDNGPTQRGPSCTSSRSNREQNPDRRRFYRIPALQNSRYL